MPRKKAQKKRPVRARPRAESASGPVFSQAVREFFGISLLAAGIFVLASLLSYQAGDGTLMGPVGRLVAGALYASVGMGGYLVGVGVLLYGLAALSTKEVDVTAGEGLGFALATLAGCVLLHVLFPDQRLRGYTPGGLAGELLGEVSLGLFSLAGTYLVAGTVLVLGLLASTPLSVAHLAAGVRAVQRAALEAAGYLADGLRGAFEFGRAGFENRTEEADEPDEADDDEGEAAGLTDGHGVDESPQALEDDEGPVARPRRSRSRRSRRAGEGGSADRGEDRQAASDPAAGEPPEDPEAALDADPSAMQVEVAAAAEPAEEDAGAHPAPRTRRSRRTKRTQSSPADEDPEIVLPAEEEAAAATPRRLPARKPPPRVDAAARADGGAKADPAPAQSSPAGDRGVPGVKWLTDGGYELPPAELFEAANRRKTKVDEGFVLDQAKRLVNVLAQFKVPGKVTKIHPGPVITRYEFKPEPGVKLSKIESLESDIAMALEAIRIRILAPIPGKSTVGFEVPNKVRETVYIKEILEEPGFGDGHKLPLALGKDIVGKPRWIDLAKAPHLLVAGATGSGKSVGVNAMISSLLYTASPEDVRMIMIDPKMLELSIYEGIPHLLLPVVTDAEKANLALRWAVEEMERRYALLSKAQVRDLAGYNKKLPELVSQWEAECRMLQTVADEAREAARDGGEDAAFGSDLPGIEVAPDGTRRPTGGEADLPPKPVKLPYIVMVIDEFADLMMVASKEVEQNVARIAAKARAAGIHMILATQRPSVDVITGTIKNNFPSRIAFQVTSDADSRTILDAKGAKQLLGMGDMLYMDRGREPQRIHGCFVSEDEILRIARFIKQQAKPIYNMEIVKKRPDDAQEETEERVDPLYDRAVQIVAEAGKVSTSMLQRRLNVGYNRAAKIVERMEAQGIIGPARGSSPREVYITAA